MQGLRCQLKSVLHDKFCLMTFLLPIIAAMALSFAGSMDFTALGQLHFGVQKDDLPVPAIAWLERYGPVNVYPTWEALAEAVNEPSTNLIGVAADQDGIKTIISGDELEIFRQAAVTLPSLYQQRDAARQATVHILAHPDVIAGFQDMFIAATLIVALFMGCTFNAMNMIAEKEDGVALINAILPMTRRQYLLQKLMVGFICGGLSALITAIICFSLSWQGAVLMLVLIILSAFVAALIGLMIGRASSGLMVGVVYIKMIMLLFIAVPILSFLVDIRQPLLAAACNFVPSQAAFQGIMDLSTGNEAAAINDIMMLCAHCLGWYLLCLGLGARQRKNT